jgi:DNA-binding transcriptional regulator/RsmH inhibitor MraZ
MARVDYFERKLDDKRRLTIPAELRAEFSSGIVMTRGFQEYLHLYPKNVWDEEVEPLLKGSILDGIWQILMCNSEWVRSKAL